MSNNLTITLDLSPLSAALEGVSDEMVQQNSQVVHSILVDAQEKARSKVAVKTGTLKRSIEVHDETISDGGKIASGQVGSDQKYARIEELGGIIAPKNKPFLSWYDSKTGKWIFTKKPVYHAPHPYLFPTLIENIGAWTQKYADMWKRIEQSKGGKK